MASTPDNTVKPNRHGLVLRACLLLAAEPALAGTVAGFAGSVLWFLNLRNHFRLQYVVLLLPTVI